MRKTNSRKILQFDVYGKFLREWDSIKEASYNLGIPHPTISNALHRRSGGKKYNDKTYLFAKCFDFPYFFNNFTTFICSSIIPSKVS